MSKKPGGQQTIPLASGIIGGLLTNGAKDSHGSHDDHLPDQRCRGAKGKKCHAVEGRIGSAIEQSAFATRFSQGKEDRRRRSAFVHVGWDSQREIHAVARASKKGVGNVKNHRNDAHR